MSKKFSDAALDYAATMSFLVIGYFFYTGVPHFSGMFSAMNRSEALGLAFTTQDLFYWMVLAYAVALVPYYFATKETSSARTFFSGLFRPRKRNENWKSSGRKLAVKCFFAPLMIHWLVGHLFSMSDGFMRLSNLGWGTADIFTSMGFFVFAFQAVLFADVLFFTLGYLVEADFLGNEIVSVDPSAFGWMVCLLCYPPFNNATSAFFGWYSSDNPNLPGYESLTVALNFSIVALMAIYASASLALGLKASNLTNRGIVARGPYALVRHPAYLAKNAAWWIGAVPAFVFAQDFKTFALILLSLVGWTFIYYLRALTEETHLLLGNNGYEAYRKKVRYRFIPGVI